MEKIEIEIKKEEPIEDIYNKLEALFNSRNKITFKIDGEVIYRIIGFSIYLEKLKYNDEFNEVYGEVLNDLRKDNKA